MTNSQPLYILKMLHIIHHHLGVDGLLDYGLEYFQIAKLISELLQKGFIVDSEDGLMLTEMGLHQLEKLNNQIYPTNSKSWLLPCEEYRIEKINKFDIYLPRKKYD